MGDGTICFDLSRRAVGTNNEKVVKIAVAIFDFIVGPDLAKPIYDVACRPTCFHSLVTDPPVAVPKLELVLVSTFRDVKLSSIDVSQAMFLHSLMWKQRLHEVRMPRWLSEGASNENWWVKVMLCKRDLDRIGWMRRHNDDLGIGSFC